MTQRRCGECTACCRILPTRELGKPAHERCRHQRFTGCAIYDGRPASCRLWACRWLTNDDADDLPRPDKAGYVLDIMPDFVEIENADGSRMKVQVVQIWVDPKRPDAWRSDGDLKAWLERQAESNVLGLVRYDSHHAALVAPPSITGGGWGEVMSACRAPEHSAREILEALGQAAP